MGDRSGNGRKPANGRQDGAPAPRTKAGTEGAAGKAPSAAHRLRLGLWVAVGVAITAAVAAGVGLQAAGPGGGAGGSAADASAAAGVGGPFRMTDQDGRAVDQSILKGKWSLVFFGYTACPDVCPATLQTLAAAQDRLGPELGPDAAKTQIVFISVDPDRDTPAALKTYLSGEGFPKGVVGLTGTPQQVADTARAYRAFYRKRTVEGGGYDMDHSAFIYLMGPDGRFRLPTLAEQQGPDAIAQAVRAAVRAG